MSKIKQAIVEDYIEGVEFSPGYTIRDGEISLSYVVDRYLAKEHGDTISLLQAAILPSKYTSQYIAELNTKIIKMFENIGLANGFIFLQGIISMDGFHFVEANYRSAASLFYRLISRVNGINYMEMLVDYSLSGKMGSYDLRLDNPRFNKYGCNLELMSQGGLVSEILGLENILENKNIVAVEKRYHVGDYIQRSVTADQGHLQFLLITETIKELKNSIKEIQKTVKVLDNKGNDMLLPPFDIERINIQDERS